MNFFDRPYQFSFKDLLAIAFTAMFLFFCCRALNHTDALELVKTLIPLIAIILGGYFGQEMASAYFNRGQGRYSTGGKYSSSASTVDTVAPEPLDPDKPI